MQNLIKDLNNIFADIDFKNKEVKSEEQQELVVDVKSALQGFFGKQRDSDMKDWKKYCYFNDLHYTRNLIYSTEKYELMILCWKTAQYSRIHDHQNSHCWMMVLDGPMKEQVYRITGNGETNPDGEEESCPNLEKIRDTQYPSGDVAYINDSMGLHSFGNAECDFSTVSMHIYAPPIRRVKIFEPTEGRVIQRSPGFYSVGAVREIAE